MTKAHLAEFNIGFARSIDCGSLCRLISRYRNGTD